METISDCVKEASADFRQSSIILSVLWDAYTRSDDEKDVNKLMKKALEECTALLLFYLGRVFGSHVLRLSFGTKWLKNGSRESDLFSVKDRHGSRSLNHLLPNGTNDSRIMESLKTMGKDLRYSSFIGDTIISRNCKEYKMRLVMVSKGFKGYSEENDSKEWAIQCPNCESRFHRMEMTHLRW